MTDIPEEQAVELRKAGMLDRRYFERFPKRDYRARRPYRAELGVVPKSARLQHKHFIAFAFRVASVDTPEDIETAVILAPSFEPCPPDGMTDPEIDMNLRFIAWGLEGDATDASLFRMLTKFVEGGTPIPPLPE